MKQKTCFKQRLIVFVLRIRAKSSASAALGASLLELIITAAANAITTLTTLGNIADFFADGGVGGVAPGRLVLAARVTTVVMITYSSHMYMLINKRKQSGEI